MFIKKTNFVVFLVLALVVGFGLSYVFNTNVDGELTSGDISKASRYNNVKEDPETAVIVEKLQNDTAFFNQTAESVNYLKERVSSLASLTEETARICSDIPELSFNVPAMNSLSAKASNTSAAFENVADELEHIADGKNAPEYEQTTNNAFIGFQKIENQLNAGRTFVESADSFLSDKNLDDHKELAGLVALWSVYCAEDAVLTDNDNVDYWCDKINTDAVTQASYYLKKVDLQDAIFQKIQLTPHFELFDMKVNPTKLAELNNMQSDHFAPMAQRIEFNPVKNFSELVVGNQLNTTLSEGIGSKVRKPLIY